MIEFHGTPSIAKLYLALMVLSILMRWAVFFEPPKGWEIPTLLFGVLSLTEFASMIYSPVPNRVLVRLTDDLKDMLIAVIVVILIQQGPALRKAMWTLILVGFFLGTLSVFQYFTKTFDNNYGGFAISNSYQIIGAIDDNRATGPMTDPNFFAEIMVVLVPISLERFLHEKKYLPRLIALWTFAVSVLTVFLTYSRGGFLAMVVAVIILFIIYPPRRIQVPFIIFSVIAFSSFLPANYLNRLSLLQGFFTTSSAQDTSLQGRLSENVTAWEMIKANPLFGVGLNSYSYLFPVYSKDIGLALVATEREAHNLYLEVAAETGVVGFSVFAFLLLISFQTVLEARRIFLQNQLPDYAGLAVGFFAGLIAYFIAAMFIHNAFPRYFYLLLGLALSFRLPALKAVPGNSIHENQGIEW
jgi:O-antigen ligase